MKGDQVIRVPGGELHMNPGTGSLEGATEENATQNIATLVEDLQITGVTFSRVPDNDYNKEYNDGRFAYQLQLGQKSVEVQMPGLPIDKVRYDKDKQDAVDFPRLYVNGSSWWWEFAIGCVKDRLEHKDIE